MRNTMPDSAFLLPRSIGGVLPFLVLAATLGCVQNSGTSSSTSGDIGGGQVGGPDQTAGSALSGQVRAVTPTAGTSPANDFALFNNAIAANFDSVGLDQATLANPVITSQIFPRGAGLRTHVAPGGGNLVDLGVRGAANDQLAIAAQGLLAAVGVDAASGSLITNQPLNNLVLNFEVIPESQSGGENFLGGSLGIGFPSSTHRLIVRGVVLSTSGSTNVATGATITPVENFIASPATPTPVTSQTPAGQVKAAWAQVGLPLPDSFLQAIADVTPLATLTKQVAPGVFIPTPIFVTTVYGMTDGASVMTVETVVSNLGDSTFAYMGLVDLWLTGVVEKNNDVLIPTVLLPSRDLHFATPPTFPDAVPNDPTAPASLLSGAPTGVAPWVTFIGRDEPGVSYTEFDPNAALVGVQRPAPAFTAIVQAVGGGFFLLPGSTVVQGQIVPGSTSWQRDIAVGSGNSAASSIDLALAFLTNPLTRTNPATGGPLPNPYTAMAILSGQVANPGAGGVVRIEETSPALIFNPVSSQFVPASLVGAASIVRTSARFGPDGSWSARVPAGFHLGPANFPTTYVVRAFGQGADPSQMPPSAQVTVDAQVSGNIVPSPVGVPTLTITATATFGFMVQDEGGLTPATLTFVGTGGTPNPDLSIPSGQPAVTRQVRAIPSVVASVVTILEDAGEGLERASGAGNVLCTLTGQGSVSVPPGSYLVIASRGPEYQGATGPGDMMQPVALVAGGSASATFRLARAYDPGAFSPPSRSGDFHVHSGRSFDSSVPLEDRITSFLASDVDVIATTDHDKVTDSSAAFNNVLVQRPDAARRLNILPGEEATTELAVPGLFNAAIGHYNAFPLQVNATLRKGGAPEDEFRPPSVLYANLRALAPSGTANIVQLNHPRARITPSVPVALGGAIGLFENLSYAGVPPTADPRFQGPNPPPGFAPVTDSFAGLDGTSNFYPTFLLTGVDFRGVTPAVLPGLVTDTSQANAVNPVAIDLMYQASIWNVSGATLTALATLLEGTTGFDTLEIMTGAAGGVDFGPGAPGQIPFLNVRLDWFMLLNFGIVRTAVTDTDTHRIGNRFGLVGPGLPLGVDCVGYPRNYLLYPSGAPLRGAVQAADVTSALGRPFADPASLTITPSGRFPVSISRLTKNQGGGRVVCTTGPYLDVTVTAPLPNGATVGANIGDLVTVSPTGVLTVNVRLNKASWVPCDEVRVIINGGIAATVSANVVLALQGSGRFPIPIPYGAGPLARDFWIVVEAGQSLAALAANTTPTNVGGGQPNYTDVVPGGRVYAFTNPIFVNVNGDGRFQPPADGQNLH